eukprot:tig00020510_g9833.t1
MLGALGASGPIPALRCLSLDITSASTTAPRFLAGGGDAEASGPRLLRELKARGARVVWHRPPPPSPGNADVDSEDEDIESGYTMASSAGGGADPE